MSSGRGRSPCDTGPRELWLDVICPGMLAAALATKRQFRCSGTAGPSSPRHVVVTWGEHRSQQFGGATTTHRVVVTPANQSADFWWSWNDTGGRCGSCKPEPERIGRCTTPTAALGNGHSDHTGPSPNAWPITRMTALPLCRSRARISRLVADSPSRPQVCCRHGGSDDVRRRAGHARMRLVRRAASRRRRC